MNRIKDLFNKKQKDVKFKKAGTGHKLSESSQPMNVQSSSNASSSSYSSAENARRTGPDANVASAALSRFGDTRNPNNNAQKPTLHDIMVEEKKKISQEMRLKEELEEKKLKVDKQLEESQKNPFKLFEDSQRFTCKQLDINTSMRFDELICKIKVNIFDNFPDDAILRSAMILFNCNRTISQDGSRLQTCLDILKKVVTNLQTENVDELEKFKRIRRSKIEQKVLNLEGALDFLFAIGFTIDTDDADWLLYVEQDEDLRTKMQFIHELLVAPQIISIELDRQVKHITPNDAENPISLDDDIKMTSSDLKKFYSNLEKNREINEMLISKETKEKLISNATNFKPLFTKLRFKFSFDNTEVDVIEAVFYSNEKLFEVKNWFSTNYGQLFTNEKETHFKVGPELMGNDKMSKSLSELKLSPAATLTVIFK
ncbi:hypothetical protein RDWZM_003430 [Blomia tropicalis]|uniref:PUB domain-containing protein n=1 Tax=Blomia tropicalis TaxID=40697 RepID=A0A9Q0MJI8_BLOTA|nr:hypothetical protein RDWZM_003430 [Blomia tropicalis]